MKAALRQRVDLNDPRHLIGLTSRRREDTLRALSGLARRLSDRQGLAHQVLAHPVLAPHSSSHTVIYIGTDNPVTIQIGRNSSHRRAPEVLEHRSDSSSEDLLEHRQRSTVTPCHRCGMDTERLDCSRCDRERNVYQTVCQRCGKCNSCISNYGENVNSRERLQDRRRCPLCDVDCLLQCRDCDPGNVWTKCAKCWTCWSSSCL
jgi:hypothetical protein